MGKSSKAADGAWQSTVHLPEQQFIPVTQGGQRAKFLNHGWDVHPFSCIPQNISPETTLLSQMLPQKRSNGLIWLCPVSISGAGDTWTGLAPVPRVWGFRPSCSLCSSHGFSEGLVFFLPHNRTSICPVWRLGSQNKPSTKTGHLSSMLFSENIADHVHCICSAQSGPSSQFPKPNWAFN